ncbi:MAG: AI-2E family transporter [Paracoccus sp. (in: a-proteobacteria)]|nr:AI-2E family transporter [Paracoccus sp. (in: a-proteobacteria)]
MPPTPGYTAEHRFPVLRRGDEKPRAVPAWAVIGIFLVLLFHFITSASAFLMPVTLGMLLFFVFAPFRRLLGRVGINATAAAAIVTLGMVMLVGGLGYFISGPVSEIVDNSPRIAERLEERLGTLRESVRPLEEAAAKINEVTGSGSGGEGAIAQTTAIAPPDTPHTPPAGPLDNAVPAPGEIGAPPVGPPGASSQLTVTAQASGGGEQAIQVRVDTESASTLQTLAAAGPSVAGQIVFTLFLLFFLLASGDLLYLKVVQSFDTMREKRAAYMAMREIESSLGSYLGAITLINAGLGVAIGLAMWFWGMPQPLLWGVAAFILNFIPYLGAVTGVAAALIVALITYDDLYTPAMVALSYLALTSLEGQLVTPYFVSRRLQLNTVVVFVTVALWAWLWSVLGMVVAVPMLVVLKVMADHIPGLEKLGNFLAGEAPPELDDEDEDEARDIIETGAAGAAPPPDANPQGQSGAGLSMDSRRQNA